MITKQRKLYLKRYRENPLNREKHLKAQREHRQRLRIKCLIHYGGNPPKCVCCGEQEIKFLSLDHINGGGRKQRKKDKTLGNELYLWLIRNNFPKDLQVLCHNCNSAKGYYGLCPHAVLKSAQN